MTDLGLKVMHVLFMYTGGFPFLRRASGGKSALSFCTS
jgi:hypothetical protein